MDASSSGISCISWTYQEAKSKCSERHSCFIEIQAKEHMSLSPYYIGRIREGVQEGIECKIHRWEFLDEYKGIIVAYNNIKLLQSSAEIYGESPSIHFDIKVNYIIFKPEIGKKLVGVVNKTSSTHVGCLVHCRFNASLAKPKFCQNGWIGGRLDIGTEFIFRVSDLQTVAGVLSIAGQIKDKDAKYFRHIESTLVDNHIEDADVSEDNLDDHGKNKKKKKLREKDLGSEKYRVQDVLQKSIEEDNSGRKKAIIKKASETSKIEKRDVVKSSPQDHIGKKKKRKDVKDTSASDVSPPEHGNSGKKKKKSREKHKDCPDETRDKKSLNNEKNNNAEKLTKSVIKMEHGSKRKRSNSPGSVKKNKKPIWCEVSK